MAYTLLKSLNTLGSNFNNCGTCMSFAGHKYKQFSPIQGLSLQTKVKMLHNALRFHVYDSYLSKAVLQTLKLFCQPKRHLRRVRRERVRTVGRWDGWLSLISFKETKIEYVIVLSSSFHLKGSSVPVR